MGANLKVKTTEISFARVQNHDLKATLRKLTKVSDEAIEVLVSLLGSTDERIRMTAADKLLGFQVDISDRIEKDAFQRLLARARLGNLGGSSDPEDNTPLVDFDNITD